MLPRDFYEIVHILGIALIFSAIGAASMHAMSGGTRKSGGRRLVMTMHGIGSLLILVGGFGMLARMGFVHGTNFPGWLWGKIIVWLLVSAAVVLPFRAPSTAKPVFVVLPLLAAVAAYLALYKPIF